MPQLTEKRLIRERRRERLARLGRSASTFTPPAKQAITARALGSYVPGLTRGAFEKHGFAAAALITEWERIVGPEFAAYTRPERLKWPKVPLRPAEGDEPGVSRPAATLLLRVDPARALEAEYKAALILDRVNTYFGYRAVAEVRVLQAACELQPKSTIATSVKCASGVSRISGGVPLPGIEDSALALALGRLKANLDGRAI
jgi:hypothetical protein